MPTNFLNRLYLICETDNMAEIARKLEIPYSTMKNYLSGKSFPSAEVLVQISNKTNAAIDWLLTGSGSMYRSNGIAEEHHERIEMWDMVLPGFVIRWEKNFADGTLRLMDVKKEE